MLLTDLRELKSLLEIDVRDTSEDKKLLFLIEMCSQWIEEFLNRPNLMYKQRTEYYAGTGTQKILLRSRPTYPLAGTADEIKVYIDEGGFFGSVSGSFNATNTVLEYGDDFCLDITEQGQPSRSGILVRINQLWPRPTARQQGFLSPFITESFGNVKVVYYGGYTVDTLPASLRLAMNLLIQRMRMIMPLGAELASEGYEERSISTITSEKTKLLAVVQPMLLPYRNWKFA